MNDKLTIDRELWIPILVGGFSVVGIIIVLLIGRALNSPTPIPATPSATPFQYVYLGTEPAITTLLPEETETVFPEDVIPPTISELATATRSSIAPPIILLTNTPGGLPTSTPVTTVVGAFVYDDADGRLLYMGSWSSQTNVSGAHEETLHVSNGIGNVLTFPFTGTEIHLFYQAGPSLGVVSITIDAEEYPLLNLSNSQTQIKEWVSDRLSNEPHQIVVAHVEGGSVNIDSLSVPAPTPTPTRQPTSNP